MPTYITLVEYTEEGVTEFDEHPERLEDAKRLLESLGGEIKHFYLTMGQYDGVVVSELPDDEAATQAAIGVSQAGAVRTETMRAFEEDEIRELIEGLPG
ncbi:MAG: GYD domain-containing protein [Halodesulfurarchaeum sp.]